MNPAVLKNLSYGMYVIGTKYNGRPNACVANSVIQISSSDPEKVLIALTKDTHSCTAIRENGIFTISVLSTDTPASVIGALGLVSGKNADKLKNIRHKVLIEGVPVVKENTCCWFLCKVISGMDVGQEMVFAAEIIAGSDSAIGTPMTSRDDAMNVAQVVFLMFMIATILSSMAVLLKALHSVSGARPLLDSSIEMRARA